MSSHCYCNTDLSIPGQQLDRSVLRLLKLLILICCAYYSFQLLSILSSSLTLYVLIASKYSFIHNVDHFPLFLFAYSDNSHPTNLQYRKCVLIICFLKTLHWGEGGTEHPLQTSQTVSLNICNLHYLYIVLVNGFCPYLWELWHSVINVDNEVPQLPQT